jgi:hypothetical protein
LLQNLFNLQKSQIDLVIPGLFDLPLYEIDEAALQQQTPALHHLLRFARRQSNNRFDIDEILIDTLGLKQKALPYAHACQATESGYSLLFKPVHLKADMNNALVFPVTESDENIRLLINDLQDYFKVDFDVHALPENLFLMQLHKIQPTLELPHYLSATGKKVTHYLEQAKSNLDWFKLFNEIQMFLFQHPLNRYREQQGLPLINSLWCWGADSWQGETFSNRSWFSDDSEMQALGRLYCGESSELDDIQTRDLKHQVTVIDFSLIRSLKGHSQQPLIELLVAIENKYLQYLLEKGSHRIRLLAGSSFNVSYHSSMRYRFWKKTITLSQLSS